MGDRANVRVVQRTPGGERTFIYLYDWLGGAGEPRHLQDALRKSDKGKWDDEGWLTAELAREMRPTRIVTYPFTSEHPLLEVDPDAQRVNMYEDDDGTDPLASWTIQQFLDLDFDAYPELRMDAYDSWPALIMCMRPEDRQRYLPFDMPPEDRRRYLSRDDMQ